MNRRRNSFISYVIRDLIFAFAFSAVNTALQVTVYEVNRKLMELGYSAIVRILLIFLLNGIIFTIALSGIYGITSYFNIDIFGENRLAI